MRRFACQRRDIQLNVSIMGAGALVEHRGEGIMLTERQRQILQGPETREAVEAIDRDQRPSVAWTPSEEAVLSDPALRAMVERAIKSTAPRHRRRPRSQPSAN